MKKSRLFYKSLGWVMVCICAAIISSCSSSSNSTRIQPAIKGVESNEIRTNKTKISQEYDKEMAGEGYTDISAKSGR